MNEHVKIALIPGAITIVVYFAVFARFWLFCADKFYYISGSASNW